jgi:hypothetical protein
VARCAPTDTLPLRRTPPAETPPGAAQPAEPDDRSTASATGRRAPHEVLRGSFRASATAGCTPGIGPTPVRKDRRSTAGSSRGKPALAHRPAAPRIAGFQPPLASACRHQPRAAAAESSGASSTASGASERSSRSSSNACSSGSTGGSGSQCPGSPTSLPVAMAVSGKDRVLVLHANRIPPFAASTQATTQAGTFMVTSTCGGCDRRLDGPSGRSTRWATLHARCRGGERKRKQAGAVAEAVAMVALAVLVLRYLWGGVQGQAAPMLVGERRPAQPSSRTSRAEAELMVRDD